jgi:Na+-driven multidrug efflux pump
MIVLGCIAVLFEVFADSAVKIFTDDPKVARVAATALRIVCSGYLFYAWGMVMGQAFNGAGDTMTPTVINFFCFWISQLPLAWFLSHKTGLGAQGVFVSLAISQSLLAVIGVVMFRRGKWKERRV